MFLVTTADQRFWKTDTPILFLGEWCRTFEQKPVWSNLNHEVLSYHWELREKYYQDYLGLDRLYERLLPPFAECLNALHNEKNSIRYWRIILSPWLYYFIQTFYDRFLSIRHAIDSGKVTLTWVPHLGETDYIPKDFLTFQEWQSRDDYNLYLYSHLIKVLGGIPFEVQNHPLGFQQRPSQTVMGLKNRVKQGVKQMLEIYSKFTPRKLNEIVMVSLYINASDLVRLQISLGQLPYPHSPMVMPIEVTPNLELRKKLEIPHDQNEFESLLSKLIPKQMPTVYLEGYAELKKKAERVFPKNPKSIFYVNAHFFDEGFKVWSAARMENGAKLLGTQHGGHYGNALWSANETHEVKVADKYYTWGWEDESKDNLVPLSSVQLAGTRKRIGFRSRGRILWLGMSRPRYSSWMLSAPVGVQMLNYIEEQKNFLEALHPEAKNLFTMRLFHTDYGWGIKERLNEAISGLRFAGCNRTMYQQLCQSRLCVGTYNSTTNLETISANFPTIAFWNFDHWKLRESARPYFEDMVRAGIFHDNPESAAQKVNEIYRDPFKWWHSSSIQEARKRFCYRFARTSESWLSEWKEELLRVAGK